jgi:benzoyl-CoA reductase subunit B
MSTGYTPLDATKIAADYQREWAKGLRAQITSGAKYAFVNADTPHELFHHMGLPIVTNQWWSAIIAAKQLSEFYFDYMEVAGFHDRLARYSSLPLIAELEGDASRQPWGGLPAPSILCARQSADDHQKIFSLWSEKTGAPLALISSPAVPAPHPDWWRLARDDWEELYHTDRLDLMVAEFEALIEQLEVLTGRSFDHESFALYMDKINEQERIYEKAAALIAEAPQCPIRISEQIPNVMIPQWHRGSDWAIEHAQRFHDEVEARVTAGSSVVDNERIRMMWIGAGLWFDTSFYSAFEESHGAVFAWSMYLPFAADGYIRESKGDPLRALAARVSAMNEQLHQPPWINSWMVEQAKRFRIDVALMLIPEHDRFSGHGSLFAKQALEAAGIRVIEVWSDMVDQRQWNREEIMARIVPELDAVLAKKV